MSTTSLLLENESDWPFNLFVGLVAKSDETGSDANTTAAAHKADVDVIHVERSALRPCLSPINFLQMVKAHFLTKQDNTATTVIATTFDLVNTSPLPAAIFLKSLIWA